MRTYNTFTLIHPFIYEITQGFIFLKKTIIKSDFENDIVYIHKDTNVSINLSCKIIICMCVIIYHLYSLKNKLKICVPLI